MPQKPIYEPEPLPTETGARTTGLPHSAYQRARLRSLKQAKEEPTLPAYAPNPKEVISESANLQGIAVAKETADAVYAHIRKQVLNARQPGLGNYEGKLPEKVQGVVDAAAAPVIKQVVDYTIRKYRTGTVSAPFSAPAPEPKPNPNAREYSDPRPAEPETLTTHSWVPEESRYKSKTVPNPKFNAIAQDISSTHEKIAAKSPTAHPEEIHRSLRQYVTKKYGDQTTEAHSARIENHRIDNYNDPKRFDAIASRLGGLHRNQTGVNGAGNKYLSIAVGGSRAPRGTFFGQSSSDSFPTIFHKIRGNWQNVTHEILRARGATAVVEPEDRSDEQEPDTSAPLTEVKKKRSSSDPALTAAARVVAKQHWSGTEAGKLAGKVKNDITGELHPTFEKTSHFKNPKAYIRKHLGHNDVDGFLLSEHSDLIRAHDGDPYVLPDLERGTGKKEQVPAAPTANFAREYAVNPLRTTFAEKETALPVEPKERKQTRAERNNAAFRGEA